MRARKKNQMPCHSSAILSSADTIIATTTTTTDMEKKNLRAGFVWRRHEWLICLASFKIFVVSLIIVR